MNSKRFDSAFSDDRNGVSKEIIPTAETNGALWKELVKLFGDNPADAIQLLKEIKLQTGLSFIEIMRLMPQFKKLEAFRLKALTEKPQDKSEE